MISSFRDRLPILDLYLFRRIFMPFLGMTVILLVALSMERVLRLVQRMTNDGLPIGAALELMGYLLPHYLGLAIGGGFLFGTLSGIRKLSEGSELVVMRMFGIAMRRLLRPVLVLAVMLTLVTGLLTAYAQPYARHAFRARLNGLTAERVFVRLRPGVFEKIGPDLTLRAKEVSADGRTFKWFFMAWNRADERRVFVAAESARLLEADGSGSAAAMKLMLYQGRGLEELTDDTGNPTVKQMDFGEMQFSIPTDEAITPLGPRGRDERELTVPELWAGGLPGRTTEAGLATLRAELHARIQTTFAVPLLGILAIPMGLIGRGRGVRAWGYGVALVVFVFFEKLTGLGHTMASNGAISPWLGIWAPYVGLTAIAAGCFYHYSGDSGRSLFGAMSAAWPQSVAQRDRVAGGRRRK